MRPTRLLLTLAAAGCAAAPAAQAPVPTQPPPVAAAPAAPPAAPLVAGATSKPLADPFASTYAPFPSRTTLIRNVNIFTAAGPLIRNGAVLMQNGKVAAIGASVTAPADAIVIDGAGKYVTPGLIDTHSHLGVYPAPGTAAHNDGNEATAPVTAHVWAEHSVWPQDPQFPRNLAGGTTTVQVLPGSANLIGGRSVTLKVVPSRSVQGMKFPGAPHGLKMACGENPKRVYANRGPSTRMANVAGYRAAWIQADDYRRRWDKWLAKPEGDPPGRDLGLETLADVLRGNILVHNHCYQADEMMQMIDIAKEFGYRIRSFHHGVEAYKIADVLARENISASIWSDWGGFKMEALDAIKANVGLTHVAGARTIVHSDDPSYSQRLNQEAAKSLAAAHVAGLAVTEEDAIRWITINPAWALGIDDRTGTLEVGKAADLVLWSANPFSVYARTEKVWVDGAMLFDRLDTTQRWRTDFELGYVPTQGGSR
ncbi:MAG: amidohydrolase [Gemmatimonadales bacterium]|nr:amidohydrolase [Gemmatimonadota bacterium]MCL4213540.1 amidohydrolase [Gemmatimonadales bacterium]